MTLQILLSVYNSMLVLIVTVIFGLGIAYFATQNTTTQRVDKVPLPKADIVQNGFLGKFRRLLNPFM